MTRMEMDHTVEGPLYDVVPRQKGRQLARQSHTRSRSRSARRLSLRPSRAPASVFGGVGGGGLRLTGRLGAFARGEGVCGGRGTFGCVFYWSKRACRGSGLSRGSLVRRSRVGRFEIWENDID